MERRLVVLGLLLASCGNETSLKGDSLCDGNKQSEEEYVDAPFDRDGDGFFDGNNDGCINTYDPEDLDCDDADENVNPGVLEDVCNGLDDDCNPDTEDDNDNDADTFGCADDCNDNDPEVNPAAAEVCGDGIDNNCDGEPDADCDNNYSGNWSVEPLANVTCNLVRVNVLGFRVTDLEPTMVLNPIPTPTWDQPPSMTGNIGYNSSTSRDEFLVSGVKAGGCTETYTVEGAFTSGTTWEGTFRANYGGLCGNCNSNYTFPFTGSKQ